MAFSMKLPAAKGKKKQYGLILPPSSSSSSSSGLSAFSTARATSSNASATNPMDEKAEARRRVAQEAARSLQKAAAERSHAQALAEDPSAFDYDGVYDEMQSARQAKRGEQEKRREAEKKKPKYISTLLEQAKIREVENERIRERRLLHERQQEDALFGDKEKLVSASYKRKLVEMKRWDDEDRRLDAIEAANDVTKQGEHALAGFYANLMTRNIAMGGDAAQATSAYTAGGRKRGDEDEGRKKQRVDDHGARGEKEPGREDDKEASRKDQDERLDEKRERRDEVSSSRREKEEVAKVEQLTEPKQSKEDAIAAARARFLARKAQRSTGK